MKEFSEIAAEAKAVIDARRDETLRKHWNKENECYEKVPELQNEANALAMLGSRLAMLAISDKLESDEAKDVRKKMDECENNMTELLVKNGFPGDALMPPFVCKKCRDEGYVSDNDGIAGRCSCLNDVINGIILKESGIPYKVGFEKFDISLYDEKDRANAEELLSDAEKVVSGFPDNSRLFILGKTGVGKTFVASMIGTELTRKGVFVVYVTLPELMRTLLYFGDDNALVRERDTMRKVLKDADMLILDELGTEKISDAKQDILTSLIDQRVYEDKKGTIVITNNTLREILDNYGERVFSRLSAMKIKNIELTEGKDLRQKIKSV